MTWRVVRFPPLVRLLVLAAVLFAALAAPSSAAASVRLVERPTTCTPHTYWKCAVVAVPLDYAHRVRGEVRLTVAIWHRPGPRRPAVFALAGGPGYASIPYGDGMRDAVAPALRDRDLVVVDLRGTGQSGALRCRGRLGIEPTVAWASACARRLGRRRAFYRTYDDSRDLESVRHVLRIPRVTLYGVSYGTRLALDYARRYGRTVDRMVLDSTVPLYEPDPYLRHSLAAVPNVLTALCNGPACHQSLLGSISQVTRRLLRPRLRSASRGSAHRASQSGLYYLAAAADGNRGIANRMPGALAAAATGDMGTLTDLFRRARHTQRLAGIPVDDFSPAVYVATTCGDGSFPWGRRQSPRSRLRALRARASRLPASQFGPFEPKVGVEVGPRFCAGWPEARRRTRPSVPRHDIPTLILSGDRDVLTPRSQAREVAGGLADAQLVEVPRTGHDVLDTEPDGCGLDAVDAFFRGLPIQACRP